MSVDFATRAPGTPSRADLLDEDSHEEARLAAVRRLGLLDTAPEERFDRVVRIARALFDVPMVEINLIDRDRQFTKSAFPEHGAGKNTPRELSFCTVTVAEDHTLVVPDATRDPRFARNPLVTGRPGIRFYAGHPLRANGATIGSLCLVDDSPRTIGGRELGVLADLASWVERELDRDAEMLYAADVQHRLLPKRPPTVEGYGVAGECLTAREVGGDFYAWQPTEDYLQVVVADVMGKGVGAALIAAGLRSAVRATTACEDLGAMVATVSATMEEDLTDTSTFVTACAVRLVPETGAVSYVDAGHGLALILNRDGELRRFSSSGLPLGVIPGDSWTVHEEHLAPGESLVLASDGILDLFESPEEALRYATYLAVLDLDAQQVVDTVMGLAAGTEDDLTVVVVRRDG